MPKRKSRAFRALVFSDPHYTRSSPAGRTESYHEHVLDKIGRLAKLARKEKVDAVLIPGDFFHGKGEVTQREVQDMITALREFDAPVLSVWGNHDAGGVSSIPFRAYGTLAEAGVVQNVDVESGVHAVVKGVCVTGWGYRGDVDGEDKRFYRDPRPDEHACVVLLTHGMLVFDEKVLPPVMIEHTRPEEIGETGAVAVVNGHVHTPQGEKRVGDTLFVCPGGIARTTRNELERAVRACVLEVDGAEARVVKWVNLKVPSAESCFIGGNARAIDIDDVRKVAERLNPEGEDVMAAALSAIEQAAAEFGYGPEVVGESRRYLNDAEEEVVR